MAKHTDILKSIRERDWTTATARVNRLLEQKTALRLEQEKNDVATSLLVPRLAEGFRRGEKVVLQRHSAFGGYKSTKPTGQRSVVPIGSTGEYVRQIDATWSVVWFPGFYDSTEVKTADLAGIEKSYLYDARITEDINVGDRIRTKRMGQTPGTVVKVENGNVHFELDEPAGKFGKRIWVAPLSNVVKEANEPRITADWQYRNAQKTLKDYETEGIPKEGTPQHRDYLKVKNAIAAYKKEKGLQEAKEETTVTHGISSTGKVVLVSPGKISLASAKETQPQVVKVRYVTEAFAPGDKDRDWQCRMCGKQFTFKGEHPVCPKCKNPDSHKPGIALLGYTKESIAEESVSQHEVQRVFDEVGDIGETELLCGISSLRVNPQGQVISYICEAKDPISGVEACGKDCLKGDDVDPEYYCGEGKPWNKHKGYYKEAYQPYGPKDPGMWVTPQGAEESGYGIDASDLGIRPGQWPPTVTHKGVTYKRGQSEKDREGDLVSVTYNRDDSKGPYFNTVPRKLVVFND